MKHHLAITPLLLITACASAPKEEEHKKPTVAVKTAVAEASTVSLTLRAPATIFPREQANITPRITGAIRQLKARKGDTVAAGALLATQENRDLTALRDEAQAQLADAQATLEKTRRGTNPTDTERARGQVETTQALLNQAQKIYDRRKALFDQGAIPQRDLLISETELATAKTNFNVATRSLKLLASESQTQDIRIAEARVEQAKSRLNNLTTQLQFADLRAPFSGTITEQFQYAGDLGQPSQPIFTLVDLAIVSARAQVPEAEAARLQPNQPCEFSNGEATAKGRVTVINRAVDPLRRTVEIWCEIQKPPTALRAAAFGNVAFQTGRLDQAVLVPTTALQLEEGTRKGTVLTIDATNTAHKREVEVGDQIGEKRVILTGLKPGETVITEGAYELPDGTKVTPEKDAKK